MVYNFKQANWPLLADLLFSANLPKVVSTATNVDEAWNSWCLSFKRCLAEAIPMKSIKISCPRIRQWYSSDLRLLLREKDAAWRVWKSAGPNRHHRRSVYMSVRRRYKKLSPRQRKPTSWTSLMSHQTQVLTGGL
ncbi:MAG: hypothetical protein GY696_11305 [Gammaproteobacteria bacterium]|nr:hypothetical protein [Gammaproteobacteria bacterium]